MKEPESLHIKIRQNTTCLICDKFFEEFQQCIWHIKIIHVLEKPVKNWHYQTISCSKFKDPILQKVKMGKISPKTIPKEKPKSTTRTPKQKILAYRSIGINNRSTPSRIHENGQREDDPLSPMKATINRNTILKKATKM